MRVVDAKNPKTMAFDVPSGLAAILIREGFVVEWQPEKPPEPEHELIWSILHFKIDKAPYIVGQCNACNPPGKSDIAHPMIIYRGREPEKFVTRTQHHGNVCPPQQIVQQYAKLVKAYYVDALQKGELQKEVARVHL